ncbi:MAG: FecR domain-containing protein [Lachnospiraceae bacterium]
MEKSRNNKRLFVGIAILLVVIAVAVVLIVVLGKKDEYRLVKIYELNGDASVTRENIGDMDAYQDMVLESGDTIVLKSGEMTLKLDDDKFVYVEPETEFKLVASGNSANSKTSIELSYGAITNEIQNPLSDQSSYEVNTPNSNMAVRGTVYRVYTYYEDGIRYTKVSVFDGKVDSLLKYADGTLSDSPVMIQKGNEILIYDDDKNTDYVGAPGPINYEDLPESVIRVLMHIIENGQDLGITTDELNRYLNQGPSGPFTVTFMYQGKVFGTQTVKKGEKVSKPTLSPAPSGSWDFDFSKEIKDDTTIEWR